MELQILQLLFYALRKEFMMKNKVKVIIYIRTGQPDISDSIPASQIQLSSVLSYCKQNEWIPVHHFLDIGFSGISDARPQFKEMISLAKERNKEFEKVVVYSYDRFSRNYEHFNKYVTLLQKHGIQLHSVTEKEYTASVISSIHNRYKLLQKNKNHRKGKNGHG